MRKDEIIYYPQNKKIVRLWNVKGVSLIFKTNSEIIYTNQTEGVACRHPYEEGILLPFNNDFIYEDDTFPNPK